MTTRQSPKTPNKSATQVAANAAAEKARKAASKAALKADRTSEQAPAVPRGTPPERDHKAENLAAVQAEAAATGMTIEEAAESMGVDLMTGQPVASKKGQPYFGPMLALKEARKHYVKAANGIECNGDALALICGKYDRDHTVRALIVVLGLGHNPYLHLNPGQQSMNLRNKARHQFKNGTLTAEQIEKAYDATAKPELKAA